MSDKIFEKKELLTEDELAIKRHGDKGVKRSDDQDSENRKALKKKERLYALKFAAIISFVCCMLLTGASVGLKGFQLENMELDRQRNILKAAGILHQEDNPSKVQIKQIYREKIEEIRVDQDGTVLHPDRAGKTGSGNSDKIKPQKDRQAKTLPLYLYKEKAANGSKFIKAYIIPIESRGLWGKIFGYLAFENDGVTIAGFTVYSHSETPGLGGEIEKAWFQKNFVGKKVVNSANEFVSIGIAKGSASTLPEEEQTNHVDGISGATLTGKYLTQGIRENLEQYEAVSVQFRQGKQLE